MTLESAIKYCEEVAYRIIESEYGCVIMIVLFMLCFTIIFISGFHFADLYLTRKRVAINQKEWDEYSKDMTDQEKMDCFIEFLYRQKAKYNWNCLYIPWIRIGDVNADKEGCNTNDNRKC